MSGVPVWISADLLDPLEKVRQEECAPNLGVTVRLLLRQVLVRRGFLSMERPVRKKPKVWRTGEE